jgi:uncharacterized lipoprotein YddW (UPF0748 family)
VRLSTPIRYPGRQAGLRILALVTAVVCVAIPTISLPTTAAWAAGTEGARHIPRRALWTETSANLLHLSSRGAIRALVVRARAAGIDTLIPEAKNAWGFVIYESEFAPHIRTSPIPRREYPAPATWFPRDFDPLRVLIEEARAAGLRVHAAVNTFGEGLVMPGLPLIGVLDRRPEWATIHLRRGPDGQAIFVPSTRAAQIAFAKPAHPEVQSYQLAVVWEIASRYEVDGIILDRTRYGGADTDFSDLSRRRFEAYLGRAIGRWPEDVTRPDSDGLRPGPLYPAWVAWRASVIQGYVRAAGRLVRRTRPGVSVGMYVGGWFSTVNDLGQNWTRPDTPPLFSAWSPALAETSVLPELDYLMSGLYYPMVTRWEALRRNRSPLATVIGAGIRIRELTQGTPLLGSVWLDLYRGNRRAGEEAVRAAFRLTDGVMVFDLSSLAPEDWWGVLGIR